MFSRWIYAGMAITTMAGLLLELSMTRIFSVVFYYHFAFLAISIALFGLGIGALLSYLLPRSRVFVSLGWLAAAGAPVVALSLAYLLAQSQDLTAAVLAAAYFSCAAPFLIVGAITSSVMSETAHAAHRIYFFDLAGAAAGCLLLIPLLQTVGAVNTVLASGALLACSSVIWFGVGRSRAGLAAGTLIAIAAIAWIAANGSSSAFDIRYAKGQPLPAEEFVEWNSFSRVAVLQPDKNGFRDIMIDADADTLICSLDLGRLRPAMADQLRHQGPGFVYVLRPAAKALVIGAGGGLDMARALHSGSRDVTGVEINPIIANSIMRGAYARFSRGIYLRPEVHIHVEDGRSFVRRSREKFDVIQATLVDTWAATAAGAFALAENNLYTVDAFHDYLDRLTDRGVISFTRWGFDPPRESLRLVALAIQALLDAGERQPWRNVIVVRASSENLRGMGALDTVLVARKPFTRDDVSRAFIESALERYDPLYLPGDVSGNAFRDLLRSPHPLDFERAYAFNATPVTDDRPFFFFTAQPRDLLQVASLVSPANMDYKVNKAAELLIEVTGVSVLATALTLALPPLILRGRLPGGRGARGFLFYFICLGVGYILVQVALIQGFVVLLGHPAYSLTVVIFTMLVASGLGSYAGVRIIGDSAARWRMALILTAALLALLALSLAPLTRAAVPWPIGAKVALAVAAIAPSAFLMGVHFPAGLSRLAERHPAAVRWAWSINAAASVMGSALAISLSIYLGLRLALLAGAAFYCCASAATLLGDITAPAKFRS